MRGTRHEALEPVRQGVAERFGSVEKDAADGLANRHDHGSQCMSRDFQLEIAWLGAKSSPAFIRAPEGAGSAERFVRTLKENLLRIMAMVAHTDREANSKRTKEALATARSRGVRLGDPNDGAAALRRAGEGGVALRAAIARNAKRHAQDLAPVVNDICDAGGASLRAIASELNSRSMLTCRGDAGTSQR